MDTFNNNGSYNKTNWATGDRITSDNLNKIEDALYQINENYVTESYVNEAISNAVFGGDVDKYVTEEELESAIGDIDAILDAINGEVL
jgi:hypothetical protein